MNLYKQQFEKLLANLKLDDQSKYIDGQIDEVIVFEKENKWHIYISFDKALSITDLNNLETAIKNFFLGDDVEEIEVFTTYRSGEISNRDLEEYYQYFLNLCCEEKPRYLSLKTFNTTYENKTIKIYVGSENEIEMIQSLSKRILEYFKDYNLKQVAIEVVVSPFETPIEKTIEERISKSIDEALKNQEMYDRINNHGDNNKAKEKSFKPRKLTQRLNEPAVPIKQIPASEVQLIEYKQRNGNSNFVIEGTIASAGIKQAKQYRIYEGIITDGEDSIIIKSFLNDRTNDEKFYSKYAMENGRLKVAGYANYDRYSRDVVLQITDIKAFEAKEEKLRTDKALKKRAELHAHTKMSTQDGVVDVEEYVKMALHFGHSALAITDHFNVQALPDFNNLTAKTDLKPIFGVEGALVDENRFRIALTDEELDLNDATYVIYDLETTGLSSNYHEIIEIAAVKMKNGFIIDEFSTFVKPKRKITEKISELTDITNDDVRDAPTIDQVIRDFKNFIDGCILVAHNATFDNSHLYRNLRDFNLFEKEYPTIDTMQLARVRYGSKLKSFNLKAVSKYFDVELTQHHRAIYDAKATAEFFKKMLHDLQDDHINNYRDINKVIDNEEAYKLSFPTHITILAQNKKGLKNLYKLISNSHTTHFWKEPRILKSILKEHREGLLLGSACYNGEVFDLALRDSYENLLKAIEFYDYLEIQPVSYYLHLLDSDDEEFRKQCIIDTIKKIIKAGGERNIPVVATGDVHILNVEDLKFREIFIDAPQVGGGLHSLKGVEKVPTQHFMTTDEMLAEFAFLGEEVAEEIVVTNSNLIAEKIERFPLFPDQLYAPSDDFMKDRGVPSFKQAVHDLTYQKANHLYGENLPKYVEERIVKELNSIIGNNYASIYYISHLLVKHSQDAGYVVGSRGSVGSSLVAFFMGITEVNGLVPHYYCPSCHFNAFKFSAEEKKKYPQSEAADKFDEILQSVGTGYDLPNATCPVCSKELSKDGCDIPFETFLGFKGDKVPDIDLNFSGEYQSRAHEFCRELFGEEKAFRAGTISTIAEKTAYGYVKGYLERRGIEARNCEINRLANKITGVKRSTGQHPGGIVVIPKEIEYTDITPVQFPADDTSSTWRTTHYDYHKFESNLLKLDILGQDDPTMIRHLMDYVEKEPDKFPFKTAEDIPLSDKKVIAIFSGLSSLGVDSTQVHEVVGTTGIPEFGTTLTKDMLREIRPKSVDDLIKISGLSHGTDVWNGNARDYMLGLKPGIPPVSFQDLICCRDDIMAYLISKNIPAIDAFKITESVRKGRGLTPNEEELMLKHQVPNWYIDSCKAIKYMFPKAHATAYVIMALRIAWFKVHRPLYYYAAFFSRRANAFDVTTMVAGYPKIKIMVKQLEEKIAAKSASNKELELYNSLLLALEMTARGFSFKQINIYKSDWRDFQIEGNSLIIPFKAMDSLGEATAKSITDARSERPFTSIKDVLKRTKVNTTLYERLRQIGAFADLPEDDQHGLF